MVPAPASSETPAAARRRVAEAARERFLASGFSAVTMDDIAAGLGMSKKTLYELFPGKRELLLATTRLNRDECQRELAAIAREETDFFARARRTFAYIARMYSRLSPAYMTDVRRNAPEVWAEIQEFRRTRVRGFMLELLDQGARQGVLRRDLDRDALVRLYLTMTTALLTPEISGWAGGERIGDVFETFVRVYFEGLITEAGRRRLAGRPR